jgi:hypothetical protein
VIRAQNGDFKDSLDMLLEEERFAKANAASPWECLLAELRTMFAKAGVYGPPPREVLRVASVSRTAMSTDWRGTFAKAMPKPQPKPARIVSIKAHPSAEAAAVVTKSFHALNHNRSLTPAARGELMLGLSSLASKTFAKPDDSRLRKVDAALALLDRAREAKLGDDADPLIEKIRAACKRGEVEPADLLHVEMKLHEIRRQLKDRQDVEETR